MANLVLVTEIVVDEVALEGLDGLTIESLWVRLAERMKWPQPLNDKVKTPIWSFVVRQPCFQFFRLASPRPRIRTYDRNDCYTMENLEECPFTIYERNDIEMDGLRGSCQDFKTRELILIDALLGLTLSQVIEEFGDTLVIVGSQEIREAVIIPNTCPRNFVMTLQQFCILERIARSRFNGETTIGKYGLNEGNFFHLRKSLLKHKLLVKQTYIEKVSSEASTTQGLLIHLPRFSQLFKPKQMLMIEQLVEVVKQQPNCLIEYTKIRSIFDDSLIVPLRKLYKQPIFTQFFETDMKVPYRQVYPDATYAQYKHKQRDKEEERRLRVLQLRNPDLDVSKMWTQDVDDDASSDHEGLLDQTNQRLDISIMEQAYRLIDDAKTDGLTQKDVAQHLGLSKLHGRAVIRSLQRQGWVGSYLKDVGRQRINTFILKKYKETVDKTFDAEINVPLIESILKNDEPTPSPPSIPSLAIKLQSDEIPITASDLETAFGSQPAISSSPTKSTSSPTKSDIAASASASIGLHLNDVEVDIKRLAQPTRAKFRMKPLVEGSITVRMAQRMKMIENIVRNSRVLEDFAKVYNAVLREEQRLGYTHTVCRRTLFRLLSTMRENHKVCLLEVVLRYKSARNQLMYVCEPDIVETDELLVSIIEKEKFKFLLRLNNERNRLKRKAGSAADEMEPIKLEEEMEPKRLKTDGAAEEPSASTSKQALTRGAQPRKRSSVSFGTEIRYGTTPKFHKIRTIHEFFFYLVFDYPQNIQVIQALDVIDAWKLCEPRIDYDDLLPELPTIYAREISWKMFVPPMIRYPPYNEPGWILLGDAILRMPLSIFISISNIVYEIPGLDEILAHPIRKHFLLSYLPPALQDHLVNHRKHMFHIVDIARRAACLGLLQFGPQRQKQKDQVFVFLNRHASQLDTIRSEVGYFQTSLGIEYPRTKYTFNTVDDLAAYWHELHKICINTQLGKRMVTDYVTLRWDLNPTMVALWHNHSRKFVLANDLGEQPGDGRGAGGLDSSLFAHLHRNWTFQRSQPLRKQQPLSKPAKVPIRVALKRKHTAMLATAASNPPTARTIGPIRRLSKRKSQNVTVKKTVKRARQQLYDDVDKQALRRMVKLRVDWNPEEDNLLLLCRAAMQVMCPVLRRLNVSAQQIRDILHWDLKSFDKTSRACQRRIVYMIKKEAVARNLYLLVQEINQNPSIRNRFGNNFYQKLRKQIVNEDDCLHALRTNYVQLVYLLKTQYSAGDGLQECGQQSVLPASVASFHRMYSAKCESYAHDRLKYSAPTSAYDIEVIVMTGLIHSSCCCVRDKTSWNIQLYEIYKNYADRTLSAAMSKVRDDHLISANKLKSISRSTRNLPLSSSPFHLSVTYTFSMLTSIPVRIVDSAFRAYKELAEGAGGDTAADIALRRIDGGYVMLLAEMVHHNPAVHIDIGIPSPVLVFDTSKCPENKALLDRIKNRFRSIFEYVQNDNKGKLRAANVAAPSAKKRPIGDAPVPSDGKGRRVTISTGEHRTVGYYVSPVERLMKQDDSMFHFYCVLDAVGTHSSVAMLQIDADKHCPFACVLSNANPVGSSIEIIHRRAALLPRINEEEQMELQAMVAADEFEISTWNVLTVFNALVNQRFDIQVDADSTAESVTDHGLVQLSQEILRDDQDPNAMAVDMGEDVTEEPEPDASMRPDEDEADGDVDDMVEKTDDKIYKMHDYFFLNPCKLTLRLASKRALVQMDEGEADEFLEEITRECVWKTKYGRDSEMREILNEEPLANDQRDACIRILDFLYDKEDIGGTNVELMAHFGDRDLVLQSLRVLQTLHMVLQTGVVEVTFVHCLYTNSWLVNTYNMKRLQREAVVPVPYQLIKVADWAKSTSIGRKRRPSSSPEDIAADGEPSVDEPPTEKPSLRPNRMSRVTIDKNSQLPTSSQIKSKASSSFQLLIKPWIRVNGSLNRRVLDRWMGVFVVHCISHPGITLERLARRFNLFVPVQVREMAEYMDRLGLVRLLAMRQSGAALSIWSTYEPPEIAVATKLDPMDSVFVEVLPHAVTRFGLFVGEKQYSTEFV